MKVETKAKRLQYFIKGNENQGFSVTGLLVRIFIYGGVLVNLILPFYDFKCNCFPGGRNRGKWVEGRNYMVSMNRAQRDYYLERSAFADSIGELGVGIKPDTDNYSYRILSPMVPVQTLNKQVLSGPYLPYQTRVFMVAQAKDPKYKSYIGVVYVSQVRYDDIPNIITESGICEIDSGTPLPSTMPTISKKEIQCPSGSTLVGR